ncbi:C2 domain-containing protein At1g53590 isoform X3 [Prunus avium]|uniref:C2 domain-containing protein At1g53590 isoform X3 n=1 Tax=Prunus avium TaxID=42229 RepID=A0A6P5TYM9_PRUAV|nr:C2 domain-containing protein At1g53590 isoform X3 [Prunus avium]
MDITEVSIIHHVGIVLSVLWLLSHFNCYHPVAYFASLIYLYLVHEQYVMRLRKKLQFEERKQANQRRKQAVVQHLYLGRNAPMLTDMRVVRQSTDDDHLVLELGLNFLTADDMIAILAVKLRKRLGFGIWAKLHITGMHIEGKVLIGVKFLRRWPFLGRVRLCFVEPPYFQMTVKPIFTHGLDVTVLPGIAGWLEKLLSIAFEQTLVEPNMLVVDMEKFVSPKSESWFSVNEKEPLAHAKVEVIEASDMKASDLNGFSDPYVKGQLGLYRFRTKIQKKTLAPKWREEFKIPIITWESPNILAIEVRDKDRFVDDPLGECFINIADLRDGQRHDMWLSLENIKTGRLHLAVTVIEDNVKGDDHPVVQEKVDVEDKRNSFASDANKSSFSSASSEKSHRVADNFEPIDVEGQKETGIWVHHPGSEVSQTWESRKGKSRLIDNEIQNDTGSYNSVISATQNNDDSGTDRNPVRRMKSIRKGLNRICSVFHRNSKKDLSSDSFKESVRSAHINLRAVHEKEIGVKFIVEDDLSGPLSSQHGEKSTRNIKHSTGKDSGKSQTGSSAVKEGNFFEDFNSSDDDPLPKQIVLSETAVDAEGQKKKVGLKFF